MKIKKNDRVKVISGKDNGREGQVLSVFPKSNRIIVEGINMLTRHRRSRRQGQKGERVRLPMPIDSSNVMLVCDSCKQASRVGYKVVNEIKARVCKKCGAET